MSQKWTNPTVIPSYEWAHASIGFTASHFFDRTQALIISTLFNVYQIAESLRNANPEAWGETLGDMAYYIIGFGIGAF